MSNHLYFHKLTTSLVTATALIAATALCASARAGDSDNDRDDDSDHVMLSFSTVGDSRQDPVTFDPTSAPLSGQDAIWLQNTKAWSRMIDSISNQEAQFLFFNGDMIMGYGNAIAPADNSVATVLNSDLMKFYRQYAFWRGMVAPLMERGTYVIPVAGNHEVQSKPLGKKAQQANEDAWRANMADLILDDARFQNLFGEVATNKSIGDNRAVAPEGDGVLGATLATDQSKLSYSFDFRGSHFAVINTDPVGNDSHAPAHWLANDLLAAKGRGVKHNFVFGHKPAYTYHYGATTPLPATPSGIDVDLASRDAFWNVIEQYNATYFCGHEHIFNLTQPRGKAWQILVGTGGSPFEALPTDATVNPQTDRDYAWATVKVYSSGKVKLRAYGFDDHFGPTRLLQMITLAK
jgi:hypothetical protein